MRSADDNWDITESVGSTALQVALGRMAETASPDPLFRDPYAQHFIEAATASGWRPVFSAEEQAAITAADPVAMARLLAMGDYAAARTRFFDDFFRDACEQDIDQVVILAAGLDARAWRLAWPETTTVYEIDQPKVLQFKADTLAAHGVESTVRYRAVGSDLRHDWPSALRKAGFDHSRPTAWSAEGLLPYLPAAGQDSLLERVSELSPRGSRIAVEGFHSSFYRAEAAMQRVPGLAAIGDADVKVGDEVGHTRDLFYLEEHADVADWLAENGWQVGSIEPLDLMGRYGRHIADDLTDAVIDSVFVKGQRR